MPEAGPTAPATVTISREGAAQAANPEGSKPKIETGKADQESKGFLTKRAEQAKNLASKLKSAFRRNPGNAGGEIKDLAAGNFDKAAATRDPDKIDQVASGFVAKLESSDIIASMDTGTEQPLDSHDEDSAEVAEYMARVKQLQDETKIPRFFGRKEAEAKLMNKQQDLKREVFGDAQAPPNNEGVQSSSETPPASEDKVQITAQKAAETQTPNSPAAEKQQPEPAQTVNKQARFDALYDSYKDGNMTEATYKEQLAKLSEPSPTEASSSETTAEPADTTSATENPKSDKLSPRDEILALGVDPNSEAGKQLLTLIDANPAAAKDVVEKTKQAKDLQEKMIGIFKDAGITLDPKKAFNFALGEVASQYKNDLDALAAAGKDASELTLKGKIWEILKALAEALGIAVLETAKGYAEDMIESGSKR